MIEIHRMMLFLLHITFSFDRLFISTGTIKSTLLLDSRFYKILTTPAQKDSVSRYFYPKGINVFEYKYIIVSIGESLHWTFLVVVNPGLIFNKSSNESDEEISCIIYFDSLKHSDKTVQRHGRNIRSWLSDEYKLSHNTDATLDIGKETLNTYAPQSKCIHIFIYKYVSYWIQHNLYPCQTIVNRQTNGYDCALYMIKYISSFLELVSKDVKFKKADLLDNFYRLICLDPKFNVIPDDISTVDKAGYDSTMRIQIFNMIEAI